MNIRSIGSRRRRRIYLIMVLALAAANLGIGHAARQIGIVNPSFGPNGACSLNGWTTSGDVKTAVNESGNCYAMVIARAQPPADGDIGSISFSELRQRFWVGEYGGVLSFFLQPHSANPDNKVATQTVSLYDAGGTLIYQKSNNNQIASLSDVYVFSYDLSSRAGQYVELRISALTSSGPDMPETVGLDIDFDGNPILYPEVTPGPGW